MNSDLPLVSIVVASYNNSKYLEECLDSAVNQTYPNIEIIIADDCSNDDSREIAQIFANQYDKITLIFREKNIGACANMNDAILNYASGKYIKVLDSDDYLDINCITNLVEKIESDSNRYAFAYGKAQLYRFETSGKVLLNVIGKQTDFLGLYCQRENLIPAITVLFRKDKFIEVGGYNPKIVIGDYYMWLSLSSNNEFVFCDKVVGFYQVGVSHSISQNHIKMRSAQILILTVIFNLNKDKVPPEVYFYEVSRQPVLYDESEIYFLLKKNQRVLSLKKYVFNLLSFIKYRRSRLLITFFPKLFASYFR